MGTFLEKNRSRYSKFKAKRTTVDGIEFASKAEATHYARLKMLEKAGQISDLKLQPSFDLRSFNDDLIAKYVADFSYMIGDKRLIEDVKGVRTPMFNLKRKWFESDYFPLKITLVGEQKKKKKRKKL